MGLPTFHYWFMRPYLAMLLCSQKPHVFSSQALLQEKLRSSARTLRHCSSEEKAVWKWISFRLPQKVTECGTGILCGKPGFAPWSRNKSFYLGASISSCPQLTEILSTLQTYTQRARKSKGHYKDRVEGSMAERSTAHMQAGGFLPQCTSKWEDHRKSIQVTSWR